MGKPRWSGLVPMQFRPPRGQKEVWLPSFTITLLRTTYLPPNMACFQVPLNLNKLDIKDYLWNAYKVPVLSVRSYIQQQKIRSGREGDILMRRRYWTRPKSTKRMIVELGEGEHGGPFVWPEPHKDLEKFDKKSWDLLKKDRDAMTKELSDPSLLREQRDSQALAEQAKALLSGSQSWKPAQPTYARNNYST